jgi:hypothetical protein
MRWSAAFSRSTVLWMLIAMVARALLPRSTRWLQWPHGLSPRGRLVYAAWSAAVTFALKEFASRGRVWREEVVVALRADLGREPSDEEVKRRWKHDLARQALNERLGREPTEQEIRDWLV